MNNISAIVVLYKPDCTVIDNINSYIKYMDCVYLWRNSIIKQSIIDDIDRLYGDKIKWCGNENNYGIGIALNTVLNDEQLQECEWLLTMDQDSYFDVKSFERMLEVKDSCSNDVAIISANHSVKGEFTFVGDKTHADNQTSVLINDWLMMSGNLVRINTAKLIGGYDTEYFIDGVDIEFCQRLISKKYKLLKVIEATLIHSLGDVVIKELFGKKIMVTNHNATRLYYIYRNYLDLIFRRNVSDTVKKNLRYFLLHKLFCVLFYERDKFYKLRYICVGWFHYVINRHGMI